MSDLSVIFLIFKGEKYVFFWFMRVLDLDSQY